MDLEIKLAFQDKWMGELDEVVRELRAEIDRLRVDVGQLRDQVHSGQDAQPAGGLADEKPPHY